MENIFTNNELRDLKDKKNLKFLKLKNNSENNYQMISNNSLGNIKKKKKNTNETDVNVSIDLPFNQLLQNKFEKITNNSDKNNVEPQMDNKDNEYENYKINYNETEKNNDTLCNFIFI